MSGNLYYNNIEYELIINNNGRLVFPMHDATIKIYKGTDNSINFNVFDDNRRKFNVAGSELLFTMFHQRTKRIALQRPAEIVNSINGQVRIRITHDDVSNLNAGYYNFSVKTTDDAGFDKLLQVDLGYNSLGVIELIDGVVPGPTPTYIADTWTFDGTYYISDTFAADSDRNYSVGLHTVAVYVTGYTGNLYIQFSLDEIAPTIESDWINVQISMMTDYIVFDDHTGIEPFNFTNVCKWIRFKWDSTTGSIDKILLRN